ncbi:MAG TPA: type II toxin-antitoxin system RelE/ParE family toxin [Candidatus Saccharimonadales bacterium]|nr:type II toxin-antitoxin system RelE/ParE family toxin [Candidatus Saccharimonadales bacterium]
MEYRICFYTTSWGKCYIRDYMDSLEADNLEFLGLVLAKLERMKAPQCHRDPLVKPIAGKKYKEIRPGGSNTARLFYVVYERDIVLLLSGYTKKEMKLRPSELRLADSIYDDLKKGGGYYEEYEI